MAKIRIRDPQTGQIKEFEIPSFNVDLSADSVFSPTSPNPQSGIAVMQAIEKYAGGGSGGVFVPPVIYVEAIENGHRVNIVYNGETIYFDVLNGRKGKDGQNGADGKTPYIQDGYWYIGGANTNVKAQGNDGTNGYTPIKGVDYFDGKDGANGEDGVSPKITVTAIENGYNVTVTDAEGTQSFEVKNGNDYILTPADKQEIIDEVLLEIPSGGGNAEIPSEVYTTSGEKLRFFVGIKNEYDALSEKENIFAIITDDNTREEILDRIEELEKGGSSGGLSIKQDMPPFFSGQMAAPFDKAIYVMSLENTTINLYVPDPVGPGSLQYSTDFISEDGVVRRLKFYKGILYVQKKDADGNFETDTDYNEDIKIMKLASVYQ